MRIHVLSDLHIEFGLIALPEMDADVIVLAGDTGVGMKGIRRIAHDLPDKPVLFVAGNHEYYGGNVQQVNQQLAQISNPKLHFLNNEAIIIDGVRFLGCTLWTDFQLFGNAVQAMLAAELSMNDFANISFRDEAGKRKLKPEDALALHQQSRAWLEGELNKPFAGPTVVITHHAPHPNSLLPNLEQDILSAAYVSDLSGLMGKAQLWIHGHTHSSWDYEVNGTRVICNPRGYHRHQLNPSFDPGLVVEVSSSVRTLSSGFKTEQLQPAEQERTLLEQVPVQYINEHPYYVRDADIPEPYRTEFNHAMYGSAMPVIDGEQTCWYAWDWTSWVGRRCRR